MDKVKDIAIVGAGLAGSSLAAVLAARGHDVMLCDLHPSYPADFRAEKLTAKQMALLDRLGLGPTVRDVATPIPELTIARFGRVVEQRPNDEYGVDYADLVNALRENVPEAARVTKRVARVDAARDRQILQFGDGTALAARLVVLATGLGRGLLEGLGIQRRIVEPHHCLAVGFDARLTGSAATALTYHCDRPAHRSAYLTLFPIGDRMRANLFLYRRREEGWSRSFAEDPAAALSALMPGLAAIAGELQIVGKPVVRPIDILATEGHRRDGVVLVGDAFATACPTGGTGMEKVLTDVDRLAALIPGWLESDGMGCDKIERFYADPAKLACDARSNRMIAYAKAMALDTGLVWTARRYRNYYAQILRQWVRERVHPRAV